VRNLSVPRRSSIRSVENGADFANDVNVIWSCTRDSHGHKVVHGIGGHAPVEPIGSTIRMNESAPSGVNIVVAAAPHIRLPNKGLPRLHPHESIRMSQAC